MRRRVSTLERTHPTVKPRYCDDTIMPPVAMAHIRPHANAGNRPFGLTNAGLRMAQRAIVYSMNANVLIR